MAFKISCFCAGRNEEKETVSVFESTQESIAPRKSVVQVRFPGRGMALSY